MMISLSLTAWYQFWALSTRNVAASCHVLDVMLVPLPAQHTWKAPAVERAPRSYVSRAMGVNTKVVLVADGLTLGQAS